MWEKKGLMITQVSSVGDLVRGLRKSDVEAKERFLLNGGWLIIKSWIEQTYSSNNKPVLHEIFNLILEFPPSSLSNALLGKENPLLSVLGMIAEEEVRENGGSVEGPTAQLCLKILRQWKRIIKDIKEEKGKLKKGTKVHVTDETGRETTYQTLGDDFRWWLVTSPGGNQEVERIIEKDYQAVEPVVVEEKRRRSNRKSSTRCEPPKKAMQTKRKPPPPPPIVRYTPSPTSSIEEDKLEERADEPSLELQGLVSDHNEKEERKVRGGEEKSSPQRSPVSLSLVPVKHNQLRYPVNPVRRRHNQESETEMLMLTEMNLEKAIRREKLLVKYRTPDLCKDEKPGGIFGKRRRLEVIGSNEMKPTEEKQEERVESQENEKIQVHSDTEDEKKNPKSMDMVDKTENPKKRNVSAGGSSCRMEGIVRLMEATQKPLYPPRKVARILPSITVSKLEEAKKKENEKVDEQKSNMIVPAIPRNPRSEEAEVKEKEGEDKQQNQVAVAAISRGLPKEDEVKRLNDLKSAGVPCSSYDPRVAAKKKREEEAKKLIEERENKNMVIDVYCSPAPQAKELDIPSQLPPPPIWKLRKILIPRRRRRARPVDSKEKEIQKEREELVFFPGDFSSDSPAEPDCQKDCVPCTLGVATRIIIIPSNSVIGTRVYGKSKSGWPKVSKDESVERIIAYSPQLFSPTLSQEKNNDPPHVENLTKDEDKVQVIPEAPTTTPVKFIPVPVLYPVPVFQIPASSPPPLPPLPATPPPPPPPPPPPVEQELRTEDRLQKYHIIRIPELPKKAYVPILPSPAEANPPREDTPTPPPPGVDDPRPISPLGPQPLHLSVPLPVPAPTPQPLDSIPETTPPFPPSLLSLPLSPPPKQQHQPLFNRTTRPSRHSGKVLRSPRRKRKVSLLGPGPAERHNFINSPPTQFDNNFFNPPPPRQFDNRFFNPSPPHQEQFGDNNPFINPPPPPTNFFYNLSGYQYPGPPPQLYRF